MSNAQTPAPANPARTWEMLCHLSGLVGFIGPLVVWLVKKNEFPTVDVHGKEALNFQITVLIALVVSCALMTVCIGFLLAPAVAIANTVFVIIASIKVNNGEPYKYPFALRLIK